MTTPPQERILDAVTDLFVRDGFASVGVDAICAHVGVAKMTLYRHFKTKDALIVAFLNRGRDEFLQWLADVAGQEGEPADRLQRMFDAIGALTSADDFYGCPFQRALVEFPAGHPVHAASELYVEAVEERLRIMCRDADLNEPATVASDLMLVMSGAFITSRVGSSTAPSRAPAAARLVITMATLPATGERGGYVPMRERRL